MLLDFRHKLYTDFIFGKDAELKVGSELKKLGATKILIVTGGGSVKRSGLFDRVVATLKEEGLDYVELSGVKPNPRLSLVREGIREARANAVDFILTIGAGSAIDTAKAIAAGYYYDGDVWELIKKPALITKVLPHAVVLTYPAAGSESSMNSVINNDDVTPMVKVGFGCAINRPVLAFMNPELTYSLPPYLTACGVADIWMHIHERYFSNIAPGSMDYMCEALFRALLEFGPRVIADPKDYEARSEIMYIGSLAHNNTVGVGRVQCWGNHGLGHEISALYDTAHGATLTITGPSWMKYCYKHDVKRFARFAKEVFDIVEADEEASALAGIRATRDFFKSLGLPTSFKEGNIPTDQIKYMAKNACDIKGGLCGNFVKLTPEECEIIYNNAIEGQI